MSSEYRESFDQIKIAGSLAADTLDELQLLRGQVRACVQVIYDD